MKVREMNLLMLFQMNSIGFKSIEYGGKNTRVILFHSAYSRVVFA